MSERKPPNRRGHGKARGQSRKPASRRPPPTTGQAGLWLYGTHAVNAALANPRRRCLSLLATAEAGTRLTGEPAEGEKSQKSVRPGPAVETVTRERIERLLPDGAVHQGLALLTEPLSQPRIQDLPGLCEAIGQAGRRPVVVVLDRATDPQNVGAVLRSAAAFGAAAVVTTRRHAPPESGALAKAASGALEYLPYLQVGNLARALETLKSAGFWSLGLSGEAELCLAEADPGGPLVLVLGAEGAGLRRLTREGCDILARLPTGGPIAALNLSNAAAVALYEVLGRAET